MNKAILRFATGLFIQISSGEQPYSGPQRLGSYALSMFHWQAQAAPLASASGHELNLLLVSMYLLIPERQPTVNTPNRFQLGMVNGFNSIFIHQPFIGQSVVNQILKRTITFGQQKNRSNRSEEIKKVPLRTPSD